MTLRTFIKENRTEIDKAIRRTLSDDYRLNDEDRRQWVRNDEWLYVWARAAGCRI